jgi:hypothetical protein
MRKGVFAICSVLLLLTASIAVLGTGCNGDGTTGTIEVDATLDGAPWEGAVEYTLTPDTGSPVSGSSVADNFTVDAGNWTCAYVSGGPGVFVSYTPEPPTQEVNAGDTVGFTLNFVTPTEVDAYVKFLHWSHNGTPLPEPLPPVVWIAKGDWIDAEYEEHVSGEEEGAVVTVHQTSWLQVHNTGSEGSGIGESIWLHCINAPGAVTMDPPAESKSNQQCTVEGNPVSPCDEVELKVCQPVNLDMEVDWELKICTNYTKNINWIGYPSPDEILFDAALVPAWHTVTLVSYACVEVGEGFEDTNPDNDCCDPSSMLTIGFLPW